MKIVLSLVVLCLLSGIAQAGVMIDDFSFANSGGVPHIFTDVGSYPVFTSTGAGSLGGVRKWQVEVTAHKFGDTQVYDVAGGEFGIANAMQQNATVSIRWDGTNNASLSGAFAPVQDLTQSGINHLLALRIASADLATQFEVVISDSDSSSSVIKSISGPASADYFFSEFAGVNFAEVTSIQLNISGPNAYDVAIADFEATTAVFVSTAAVPEPSSAAIVALFGIAGLFVRRSR